MSANNKHEEETEGEETEEGEEREETEEVEEVGEGDATEYESVFDFVDRFIARVFSRNLNGRAEFKWCEKWVDHEGVFIQLYFLWHSYEALGEDEVAEWLVHVAYPLMDRITDAHGPFIDCACAPGVTHMHKNQPHLPIANYRNN